MTACVFRCDLDDGQAAGALASAPFDRRWCILKDGLPLHHGRIGFVARMGDIAATAGKGAGRFGQSL